MAWLELMGPLEEVNNKGEERTLLFVFVNTLDMLLITWNYTEIDV